MTNKIPPRAREAAQMTCDMRERSPDGCVEPQPVENENVVNKPAWSKPSVRVLQVGMTRAHSGKAEAQPIEWRHPGNNTSWYIAHS